MSRSVTAAGTSPTSPEVSTLTAIRLRSGSTTMASRRLRQSCTTCFSPPSTTQIRIRPTSPILSTESSPSWRRKRQTTTSPSPLATCMLQVCSPVPTSVPSCSRCGEPCQTPSKRSSRNSIFPPILERCTTTGLTTRARSSLVPVRRRHHSSSCATPTARWRSCAFQACRPAHSS